MSFFSLVRVWCVTPTLPCCCCSDYPVGLVTASHHSDLKRINEALAEDLRPLQVVGLYPEPDQIERLALSMPKAPFDEASRADVGVQWHRSWTKRQR